MNPLLKPIKTMNIVSFALHTAAMFFAALLVSLRYTIIPYFYTHQSFQDAFPLPSLFIIIPIVLFFALHAILTTLYWKALQNNTELKVVSILSLAFVIVIVPLFSTVLAFFAAHFHARYGVDYMIAQNILHSIINFALTLRMFGLSALIVTASMSLYYVHYLKAQQKIGEHNG